MGVLPILSTQCACFFLGLPGHTLKADNPGSRCHFTVGYSGAWCHDACCL